MQWGRSQNGRKDQTAGCSHRHCKSLSDAYPACPRCFKPQDFLVETCHNLFCVAPTETLIYCPYFPFFMCLLVQMNSFFTVISDHVADLWSLAAARGLWTTGWVMLLLQVVWVSLLLDVKLVIERRADWWTAGGCFNWQAALLTCLITQSSKAFCF